MSIEGLRTLIRQTNKVAVAELQTQRMLVNTIKRGNYRPEYVAAREAELEMLMETVGRLTQAFETISKPLTPAGTEARRA